MGNKDFAMKLSTYSSLSNSSLTHLLAVLVTQAGVNIYTSNFYSERQNYIIFVRVQAIPSNLTPNKGEIPPGHNTRYIPFLLIYFNSCMDIHNH